MFSSSSYDKDADFCWEKYNLGLSVYAMNLALKFIFLEFLIGFLFEKGHLET